jgi:hypothetical protein
VCGSLGYSSAAAAGHTRWLWRWHSSRSHGDFPTCFQRLQSRRQKLRMLMLKDAIFAGNCVQGLSSFQAVTLDCRACHRHGEARNQVDSPGSLQCPHPLPSDKSLLLASHKDAGMTIRLRWSKSNVKLACMTPAQPFQ